jgi:dTDP-glucose 4,6-dehydratase
MILNALQGQSLPIYGDGMNVRDWLYVEDHCAAIVAVLKEGNPGETYNIGGSCEMSNRDVVESVCRLLDELIPSQQGPYSSLITFVKDRPGHDRRYGIDATKISKDLGSRPKETFQSGLRKTVNWYLESREWVETIRSGSYREWIDRNYTGRAFACEG